MLYAKGGWSMGSTRLGYTDFDAAKADKEYQPYARKKTRSGFHLGAALEVPFGFDLYGKIEYAYTDYGRDSFTVPAGTSATSDDVSASIHMRRHQAVAGFGIRF